MNYQNRQDRRAPVTLYVSKAEESLNNYLRLLWLQHVYWTRMDIQAAVFDLPDAELTTERLLQNPGDFEVALRPFFGQENAATFANLLTAHLTIAGELVGATKEGKIEEAAAAETRWYENADQIAQFLGQINPHWSAQDWKRMFHDHLAMTKVEAVDMMTPAYEDSIQVFGDIEQEALDMADVMTEGIVEQFSQYFV